MLSYAHYYHFFASYCYVGFYDRIIAHDIVLQWFEVYFGHTVYILNKVCHVSHFYWEAFTKFDLSLMVVCFLSLTVKS